MLKQILNFLASTYRILSIYISNNLTNAIQFLFNTKNLSFWSTLIKLPKLIIFLNYILLFFYIIRLATTAIVCWCSPERLGFVAYYLDYDKLANIFVQIGFLEPTSCIAYIILTSMMIYFNYMMKFSGKCKTWQYAYEMTI